MLLFRSLTYRPFALLWAGQTISRIGDYLYQIALAWWVLEKTGSATAMGAVLICSLVPMLLFLLIGGVAVDRLPRVRVMLASDLARGAIVDASDHAWRRSTCDNRHSHGGVRASNGSGFCLRSFARRRARRD